MQTWIYWVLFSPLAVQVVFLIAKWAGFIDWSWWWIMSPSVLLVVAIVALMAATADGFTR